MLRNLLILILLFVTPVLAAEEIVETDCNNPRDTPDYSDCAYQAYMTADEQLNDLYKNLLDTVKDEKKVLLVSAQKLWIKFRDAHCDFETFDVRGGTGWSAYQDECLERMTLQRNSEIKDILRLSAPATYSISSVATSTEIATSQFVTTVSDARVRTAPSLSARQMVELPIGTIITQTGRKEEINLGSYWYQIKLEDGREGWIFGDLLMPFIAEKKAEIYLDIAHKRLAKEELTFDDVADLLHFLARVSTESLDTNVIGELKLLYFSVLKQALALIPSDETKKPPYQQFLEEQRENIFLDYVSGEWLINTAMLWNLHTQYHDQPIAETIAWQAADMNLGGECEGDIACHIHGINDTWGKYLLAYPQGIHAAESMNKMITLLTSIVENAEDSYFLATTDAEYMADFKSSTDQLRHIITHCSETEKQSILQLLGKIESF